jgi:16S rRNA G1207 methylase RsmC
LHAIEELIIHKTNSIENYLDVGAGDGVRSLKIASKINAKKIVLLDNSYKNVEKSTFYGRGFNQSTIPY